MKQPTGVVNIKGREYTTVARRVQDFRDRHPDWSLSTTILHRDLDCVVVQASIADDAGRIRATGHAEEFRKSSEINRTSALENCECVPLTVPALTRDGWRFFHQIRVGDELLTYNVESDRCEWQPVLRVSTFEAQPVVLIGNTRFAARCTPNHKWVINGRLQELDKVRVTGSTVITLAAPLLYRGGDVEQARRLGWIFGDGVIKYCGGLASSCDITQAKEDNFGVLTALFGEPTLKADETDRYWPSGRVSKCRRAFVWRVPAAAVRQIMSTYMVNTSRDLVTAVCRMTFDEAEAFLDSMLRADGSSGVYAKTDAHLCSAVQLAMFLTGHATGSITERAGNDMTTMPCLTVSMHKTRKKRMSEFQITPEPPCDVWCPTTPNGTWIGLFGGRPAITGNTSAIGRALAALGFGGTEFASADELVRAVSGQKGDASGTHNAPRMAFEALQPEVQDNLRRAAPQIVAYVGAGKVREAIDLFELTCDNWDDDTVKPALWSLLDSGTRSSIKKFQAEKEAA